MKLATALSVCFCLTVGAAGQSPEKSWLDRPLKNWNDPARGIQPGMATGEQIAEMAKRCNLSIRRDTPAQRALAEAGWFPYLHVDREIVQRDVEIVGGMTQADGMCRPMDYNIFVFAGGRLAGTLSPLPMMSRTDGAIGAVRLAPDDTIAAEFARYADRDALCCPSGRVTVRYRIDQKGSLTVVVPESVQATRP
jgi:LppP/LprE lipoprotein